MGVSATTGMGMVDLFKTLQDARAEYDREYWPMIEERKKQFAERDAKNRQAQLDRLRKDIKETQERKNNPSVQPPAIVKPGKQGPGKIPEEEEVDDEYLDPHGGTEAPDGKSSSWAKACLQR